jgi:hypothetical protein
MEGEHPGERESERPLPPLSLYRRFLDGRGVHPPGCTVAGHRPMFLPVTHNIHVRTRATAAITVHGISAVLNRPHPATPSSHREIATSHVNTSHLLTTCVSPDRATPPAVLTPDPADTPARTRTRQCRHE